MSKKQISSALISVFDKTGLAPIIHQLNSYGVTFYSTGGTEKFIRDMGYEVTAVEDVTGYPSILGGRVKTLHPKVFGGILNRQDVSGDQTALEQFEIAPEQFDHLRLLDGSKYLQKLWDVEFLPDLPVWMGSP